MGRKSSLTPEQWAEVERRYLVDGESINALAAEFKVNESSIRRRIKPSNGGPAGGKSPLHALAEEKARVDAENKRITAKIAELPIANQLIVSDLARKLSNISEHIGSAAEISAASAHRLSILANQQLEQVDDVNPLSTGLQLKTFEALQKMANGASEIPMNLLRANKETIESMNRDTSRDPPPSSTEVTFRIVRPNAN
jgi:transposase-like protein